MTIRTLIVAGNFNQASYWADVMGLHGWTYLARREQLRGWSPEKLVYCGTYGERPDWDEIRREIRLMKDRLKWEVTPC